MLERSGDKGTCCTGGAAEACSAWRDKQVLDSTLHNSFDSMPRSTDRVMTKATSDFRVGVKRRALQHLIHSWAHVTNGLTPPFETDALATTDYKTTNRTAACLRRCTKEVKVRMRSLAMPLRMVFSGIKDCRDLFRRRTHMSRCE